MVVLLAASACGTDPGKQAPSAQSMRTGPAPGTRGADQSWTDVSPAELSVMLEQKDFVLVNVHTPYEGELPKTDAFIPYDQVGSVPEKLPGKEAKIVVYCRTGRMSQEAIRSLSAAGYSNLYQLKGGFDAWTAAGLPFTTNGTQVNKDLAAFGTSSPPNRTPPQQPPNRRLSA